MMLDTNFPGKKKQPDSAFIPNPRPNPNNLLANLIQLQPILGLPWPTIVLEVGNSEPVTKIIERRVRSVAPATERADKPGRPARCVRRIAAFAPH